MEEEGSPLMNVTLNLNPEVEKGLTARAHARGVSLDDYLHELIAREAGMSAAAEPRPVHERFDLERSKDHPRQVDLA